MSFRLKEAVYKIRCRAPGCNFISEFAVKENLMGVTEADIDSEAIKIAKNLAYIKHDALHGTKHELANPEIFKVAGSYERIGGLTASSVFGEPAAPAPARPSGHSFSRGDLILAKSEGTALACEVVRGAAYNEGHPELRYRAGAIFGSAPIFHQRARPTNVVAAEDNTVIAFHEVQELTRSNPSRARELYDRAVDDIFLVLNHLQEKVRKLESVRTARKPRAKKSARKPVPAARKKAKSAAAKARKPGKARRA